MRACIQGFLVLLLCAGCRGPDEGDQPPPERLDHLDELVLRERVRAVLMRTSPEAFSGVQVFVTEGVVTLAGPVPSREARRMAEQEVLALPEVRSIENHLLVLPPPAPPAPPPGDDDDGERERNRGD